MTGYFLLTLGELYIDEAVQFTQSLRRFKDNRPVSILVKEGQEEYAQNKGVFDKVLTLEEGTLYKLVDKPFEKYCLLPRLEILKYLPYREAIVIDTDVICIHDPENLWRIFRDKGQPFNCTGSYYDPSYHWEKIDQINEKLKMNIQAVHGGLFYINKQFGERELEQFFLYFMYAFVHYDELGFKRALDNSRDDSGLSMTDEILIGYAMSKMNFKILDFSLYPSITFEMYGYLADKMKIPNYIQSWYWFSLYHEKLGKDYPEYLNKPIPFIHCFGSQNDKSKSYEKIKKLIYSTSQEYL